MLMIRRSKPSSKDNHNLLLDIIADDESLSICCSIVDLQKPSESFQENS